jgi:hypothetical protein
MAPSLFLSCAAGSHQEEPRLLLLQCCYNPIGRLAMGDDLDLAPPPRRGEMGREIFLGKE